MIRSVLQTQTLLEDVNVHRIHISRNETLTTLHVEPGTAVRVEIRLRAQRPESRSSIPDGEDVYSVHSGQSGAGGPGRLLSIGQRGLFIQGVE